MKPLSATILLLITYLGFVSLGLPDSVLGVIWPSAHRHFGVTPDLLGVVLAATVSGYLVSSTLTGRLLQRLGVGGLLAASCALVTLSLAGFAFAPSFGRFAASGILAGLGAGAIDSGLNSYAARHFSARHMNWLHACWGAGATLGASTAAVVIARGHPWQSSYGLLGVVMLGMTLLFTLTRGRWREPPGEEAPAGTTVSAVQETAGPDAAEREGAAHGAASHDGASPDPASMAEALRHPLVWVQMLTFLLYTGTEMTAGQWAFTLLTQHRDLPETAAGMAVTMYWGSLTLGRFLLGSIADRVGVERLVGASVTTALVGGLGFVLAPAPWVAFAGLALLGLSLAPIYPGMMTVTPQRLGRFSEHAVGFQVAAATLGALALPSLGGVLLATRGATWLNGLLGGLVVLMWGAIALWFLRGRSHRP